ncbi:MAG TPA: FAD/NAD(P)-binding oxidoreductase [Nitrososphaerales archaeon]|nr:FAD/NAD(P)-binding oxidoreductase [Nitrososphaerales archaeon]
MRTITVTKVCVVGGGTAGLLAAAEASNLGLEVTVVEKAESPEPPWSDLPDLIGPSRGLPGPPSVPPPPASVRVLISEARSCKGGVVVTDEGDVRCDSLVLATGSAFEPPWFRGSRKPGVFLLDSERSYRDLGREAGALGSTLVVGEGRRSLEVAERLTGGGRTISVVVSHWQGGSPSPPVLDAIADAAKERSVSIAPGRLAAAVGTGRVEAAVVDDAVLPCESIVYVPRRLPRFPVTEARLGPAGAVLVGRNLATGVPGAFAAGGCAEMEGVDPPATLAGEPWSSGRIAGANCLGGSLSLNPVSSAELLLFGVRWVTLTARRPRTPRRPGRSAVWKRGEGTACQIVFDGPSGRVEGIEFVNTITSRVVGEVPPTLDLDLRALAYGGTGSSDISLISETARLGLAR